MLVIVIKAGEFWRINGGVSWCGREASVETVAKDNVLIPFCSYNGIVVEKFTQVGLFDNFDLIWTY